MPSSPTQEIANNTQRITPRISVDIGQYHFIGPDGWSEEWQTITAGEWWQKHLWLKAGGHKQEGKGQNS